jgi:hypothetical protein
MRLVKLLGFLFVLLMLGLVSSGVVVHHVQAQVVDFYPFKEGIYDPLAGAGLWSALSGHIDYFHVNPTWGGLFHRVESAALYFGHGTEPMAAAATHASVEETNANQLAWSAKAYAHMSWPYRVFDRNTGSFLNRPGSLSIPMHARYRIGVVTDVELLLRGSMYAVAKGHFEVTDYVSSGDIVAVNGKNSGSAGTLHFDYTGPPWPKLRMVIEANADVSITTPGGSQSSIDFSAVGEAEAVVDPYLYIDPAFPLADELELRTLNSIDAPLDDPSSWVPAVETPVSFIPTTTVDTNPRTVNEIGSETTKISGNLTSNGTGLEGKTMILYYQNASAEYETPSGNWTHIANVTTGSGGHYEYDWNPEDALATGNYCVKAVFEGDVDHLPSSATTGVDAIPNLVIVPEMPLETIAVLATMMLTSAEVVVLRKKRTNKLHVS